MPISARISLVNALVSSGHYMLLAGIKKSNMLKLQGGQHSESCKDELCVPEFAQCQNTVHSEICVVVLQKALSMFYVDPNPNADPN